GGGGGGARGLCRGSGGMVRQVGRARLVLQSRKMILLLRRYTHWLHTQWPAGVVEKLPEAAEHGLTNLPGVRIVGDLTGIPLLKFSSKTGADAVREILREP